MSAEIAVGPQKLVLNHGASFLVSAQDAQINWPTDQGLYVADTRLLSAWMIFANGEGWDLLTSANIAPFAARAYLTNRLIATETGDIPPQALGLVVSRNLQGGMHEDIDLTNHSQTTIGLNLEIVARADFADLFEVKSQHAIRRGRIATGWDERAQSATTTYEDRDFRRAITVRVRKQSSRAALANGRLTFDVSLAPGDSWHACLLYEVFNGTSVAKAPRECIDAALDSVPAKRLATWQDRALNINTPDQAFRRFYRQAVEDMVALRLPIEDTSEREFVPAAGVPWFVGLFGRDSLIVSHQTSMVYPDLARGTLDVLAHWQATERDDYRDAEPGKIMHELRTGELAHFKLIPHTPYYGTADATPLYLIVLHMAWRCTGDASLLERHLETAEGCLKWIDEYGDRDGDGFQEYQTRSSAGYENQSWKDSGVAVVYPDGSLVKGPKALCELQGYVYDAWTRMAEIYDALGDHGRSAELRAKAKQLFERFNEAFWDEESGFYAFCLDGEKQPVLSVASNPGHCLWSGIVPRERAGRVVRRLMAPDMWSGWGIRTLSAHHPAYNPHDYQTGAVWPHDNGLIALGFRRYGFATEACRVARAISDASSYFVQNQMPELFSGLARTKTNFPVLYQGANVPQAWAAGSAFSLLHAIVGYQPDAPHGRLYIDPALPDWMPELALTNLQVGGKRLDLHLWRDGAESRFEVVSGPRRVVERRPCACGPDLPLSGALASDPDLRPASPSPDLSPEALAKGGVPAKEKARRGRPGAKRPAG